MPRPLVFCLLTVRSPPRSPLFPYTTLFRSLPGGESHDLARRRSAAGPRHAQPGPGGGAVTATAAPRARDGAMARFDELLGRRDRKSTRLNSSHPSISYAVFCLKKKKTTTYT